MSTVDRQDGETGGTASSGPGDLKLEVVVIPVADADRSKAFYDGLGWRLDADFSYDNGFRVVQFTPSGSPCSVQFGKKITGAPPGSAHGLYLIVSDIDAGRDEFVSRGVKVSEVFHAGPPGAQLDPEGTSSRLSGPDPDDNSYSSFATFEDPDGNSWLLQAVTDRLPGSLDPIRTSPRSTLPVTWPGPCDVPRQPTANTRSGSARLTRIGRIGMPSTWSVSRAVRSCRRERFRRDRAGRRCTRRALRRGPSRRVGFGSPSSSGSWSAASAPTGRASRPSPSCVRGGGPGRPRRRRQRRGERAGGAGLAGLHGVRLFGCGTGEMAGGSGHRAARTCPRPRRTATSTPSRTAS
jgi:catechol 2,3-dioxygenase-like lactoylglutathione lyase family enzyme